MRIVAGKYRHRLINFPQTGNTRPTMDKVREALMSAIGMNIYNRVVLDLFAGSGALGIESLSRGAKCCYFVDNDKTSIKVIKDNISIIGISEEVHVEFTSYKDFLQRNKDKKFSLLFLDPPYKDDYVYQEVVDFMIKNDMLTSDAIVVCEADKELNECEYFKNYRHYKYGTVHVNIYWR